MRACRVPNVPLLDEHAGVVDGLCKPELVHLRLQPALQQILDLQAEYVVEFGLVFWQDAGADKTAKKSVSLKETAGVLTVSAVYFKRIKFK